jgi:hypothetical protein
MKHNEGDIFLLVRDNDILCALFGKTKLIDSPDVNFYIRIKKYK